MQRKSRDVPESGVSKQVSSSRDNNETTSYVWHLVASSGNTGSTGKCEQLPS